MTFQLASVNRQFNTASESFQTSFRLTHKGDLLFSHEIDSSSSKNVIIATDTISIKNHFFQTGEELTYEAFDGKPIGINHASPGIGAATTLPSSVFVIKTSENTFKLAASRALALSNSNIGFTTVGVGTTQSFTTQKPDTKCLISFSRSSQFNLS